MFPTVDSEVPRVTSLPAIQPPKNSDIGVLDPELLEAIITLKKYSAWSTLVFVAMLKPSLHRDTAGVRDALIRILSPHLRQAVDDMHVDATVTVACVRNLYHAAVQEHKASDPSSGFWWLLDTNPDEAARLLSAKTRALEHVRDQLLAKHHGRE